MKEQENVIIKQIDDRALVLALDYLYRENIKIFEVDKLLPASKVLIATLEVSISSVPIEGYYNESEELTEYFTNIRALQQVSEDAKCMVHDLDEYRLLFRVVSSEIFGSQSESDRLLPARKDSLYFALEQTDVKDWNVKTLTEKAHDFAVEKDDISLVGIAAFVRDSVALAALRESVVLYAGAVAGCALESKPPRIEYVWNVSPELAEKVNRFVDIFNQLILSNIKQASAANVKYFYDAFEENEIAGRCVRIGYDDRQNPLQHYHWGIKNSSGRLIVDEFWHPELWTTQRYQAEKLWCF